jgi:hypothetical protein
MFFIPGFLLSNLIFNRREFAVFEIIPVSMCFSIALLSILGISFYLINLDIDAMLRALPLLVLLLILLNIAKRKRHRGARVIGSLGNVGGESTGMQDGRSITVAMCALLLLAAALMLYRGGVFGWSSDAFDHVGTIREIVETRQILPADAYYGGQENFGPDPRKGMLHACLAILSIVTGVEPFQIWLWLPAFLLPILLCGYFAFSKGLFRSSRIALLSSVLFFVCFGGLDRGNLRLVGYPIFVAYQMYLIALFLMFKYLENEKARYLVASGFLGAVVIMVHVYYFFQFLLALAVFLICAALCRRERTKLPGIIAALALITLVFSAPLLVVRYRLSYEIANPFDMQPRHLLYLTQKVFITNPVEAWEILGPIGILAFMMTPFLFRHAKRSDGILFLFSAMVATPLIILNPLAVYVLGRIMTLGLVRRIAILAPYIAVMGYFVYQAGSSLRGRQIGRSTAKALGFLSLFALLLLPYAKGFPYAYGPAAIEYEKRHSYLLWRDALHFMQERIAAPSVMLSDPLTSFSIPAFTRHSIVNVLIGHASPQDAENIDRVIAASNALNPYIDMERTISILDRYHVDYVVVNQTFPGPIYEQYWSINPKYYSETRKKFESHPRLFETIYDTNGIYIYRYHPAEAVSESEAGEPASLPFVFEKAPEMQEAVNVAFGDQFMLLGVDIDKKILKRGDSLDIRCFWKCRETNTTAYYYRVFVRFDTQYRKTFLYGRYYSKIYRIALQKLTGKRYRFRSEHNPVNGIYPPMLWRKGEIVEDEFEIVIPRDVSAGVYDIRINLLNIPFSPNYRISDLLCDTDIYEGAKIGSITVR